MFDGIYVESELIFWIRLVLLNKLDWLAHGFQILVQCIQFRFHFYMVFQKGSSFYIFRFHERINVKSAKIQLKKSYHTRWRTKSKGSDKLWYNSDKTSKVENFKSMFLRS